MQARGSLIPVYSKRFPNTAKHRRLIFLLLESHTYSYLHLMETGSLHPREGCFLDFLDQQKWNAFFQNVKKIQLDQATLIVVTPGWQTPILVPWASANVNKESLDTSKCFKYSNRAKQNHRLIEKQNLQLLASTVSGEAICRRIIRRVCHPYCKCQETRDSLLLQIDLV